MKSAASATITVNDEPRALSDAATLGALVTELGFAARKGVAIAVNGSVVPRTNWPAHALTDGDKVLVIRATQGG